MKITLEINNLEELREALTTLKPLADAFLPETAITRPDGVTHWGRHAEEATIKENLIVKKEEPELDSDETQDDITPVIHDPEPEAEEPADSLSEVLQQEQEWLSPEEAVQYLGFHTFNTLCTMRSAGKGPAYHKVNGRVVYRAEDLDAYKLEHEAAKRKPRARKGSPKHTEPVVRLRKGRKAS